MSLVASQDPKNKFAAFSMHRQRLRDALLEPVREYVQFGATVKRVVPDDDVAKVLLDNGDVVCVLPCLPYRHHLRRRLPCPA